MVNVEIEINGKKRTVEVHRISWKKYLSILKRVSKTKLVGEKAETAIEPSDYRWEMLKETITGITDAEWDIIDAVESMKLEKVSNEVNSFDESFQQ